MKTGRGEEGKRGRGEEGKRGRGEEGKDNSVFDPHFPTSPLPLFLIGPRGSGKTTVARLLAGRLGWDWADADDVLEARHGKSIRTIFAEEGEAGFRDKEAAILAELCGRRRCVVALGGGVVVREANRALVRASGRVVWLTADAETLWRRTRGDATTPERRPPLTVGGRAEVEQVLRVREPWYRECAHCMVRTDGRTPEEAAAEILRAIGTDG